MFGGFALAADDWLQWRGPDRSDRSQEYALLDSWPEGGPTRLWINEHCGLGYAGFSVSGDRLFTMGAEDEHEFALCLNAVTGQQMWRVQIASRFQNPWGHGPRSTPTIDGQRVYFMTAKGHLACLEARSGEIIWARTMKEFGGVPPMWGYSESPLVDGKLVVCTPGGDEGLMLALDKMTGKKIWQSDFCSSAHYSSIVTADLNNQRQYIQLTLNAIVGISADDGRLLWQAEWPGQRVVIPTPITIGNQVYATSGNGAGSKLIEINDGNVVDEKWYSKHMKNQHGGVIFVDGYFYGYSDNVGWICQSLGTGKLVWRNTQVKKGAITYADGRFYHVQERDGQVVLIRADERGLEESGRFTLEPQSKVRSPDGMIWVHPVIANGRLYLRDQEYIFCFDVRDTGTPQSR